MTALMYRQAGEVTVIDEDDGCEPGNHRRDAPCARTRLDKLPPADEPEPEGDKRGEAT